MQEKQPMWINGTSQRNEAGHVSHRFSPQYSALLDVLDPKRAPIRGEDDFFEHQHRRQQLLVVDEVHFGK